jgi:hypothetical protein
MEVNRATRTWWKYIPLRPLPAARARLKLTRSFSPEEHRRLALGLVPKGMEDKWLIFLEDGWLYFHRSWTGKCVYTVRLRAEGAEGEGSAIEEAWVNRDPEEYKRTDDAYDARLLGFLMDRLLLDRDVPFPLPAEAPEEDASLALGQNIARHARANDEK